MDRTYQERAPFLPKLVTTLAEGYGPAQLKADLLAGLTVAIVALPLSMAIAIASGVAPEHGLYTAIVGGFLGSALGGARLWSYPHWSDALGDALRLSAAMTLKNAAAGLDAGGGKSVIALPPGTQFDAERRRAALAHLDAQLASMPAERAHEEALP